MLSVPRVQGSNLGSGMRKTLSLVSGLGLVHNLAKWLESSKSIAYCLQSHLAIQNLEACRA
jgi:hypothetical protein